MNEFQIRCRKCNKVLKEVYCAFCEHCTDALLVTEYADTRFKAGQGDSIWRFNWLPVREEPAAIKGPLVYRSEALAGHFGLENLWIAFNGYWPERGAQVASCTFKEFEAAAVLENARENGMNGLVVASAGNTARAFAYLASKRHFPTAIVVPGMCLDEMWYLEGSNLVPTFIVQDGDYSDAIDVAKRIAALCGIPFEGGVKNVAKRDGLGVVLLEAVDTMGRLPDHYIQAVGSGAGAIAVWEMADRFIRDGRFGKRPPRLHLVQNLPFAPMYKAWMRASRQLDPRDLRPELIWPIATRVLSTRYPAYGVQGGVYDALSATNGAMYGVENDEIYRAMELFEKLEGIDIVPAAGAAVAALVLAVGKNAIRPDEHVLLNITGGGEARIKSEDRVREVGGTFISKTIKDSEIERTVCIIPRK